ncbi:hypothetical protein SS05631_c02250 [Sinorhizobium sp. CCBAU 05631]|nr:hypothetical protein SS05631_c02250 [Sinorhizobium sp. CCBAU 05631]
MVEQRIENPRVGGSNPPPGTIQSSPKSTVYPISELSRHFREIADILVE